MFGNENNGIQQQRRRRRRLVQQTTSIEFAVTALVGWFNAIEREGEKNDKYAQRKTEREKKDFVVCCYAMRERERM